MPLLSRLKCAATFHPHIFCHSINAFKTDYDLVLFLSALFPDTLHLPLTPLHQSPITNKERHRAGKTGKDN